jgi:hypothetical protein
VGGKERENRQKMGMRPGKKWTHATIFTYLFPSSNVMVPEKGREVKGGTVSGESGEMSPDW